MDDIARLVTVLHRALDKAGVVHGFGGALALAAAGFVRATRDVDINVFLPESDWDSLFSALESCGVESDRASARVRLHERADLQVMAGTIRVDIFTPFDPFHDSVRTRLGAAPLGGEAIPVVSAEDLVVFKVLFDRPKDWVDLESLKQSRDVPLDGDYILGWLERLLPADDPRAERLARLLAGN